jgi:hypothetical protein
MNPFFSFIGGLISPITNTITKINTNKTEVKKLHIERIVNAEDKLAEWESIQAEKDGGWRDDWFSIVLSVPLVGAFIPPFVPTILNGFDALSKMPGYYQYWVAVAILSSFGVRALKK